MLTPGTLQTYPAPPQLSVHGPEEPFEPHTRQLRALAVLLLWSRVPKLFLLSSSRGPLVLMFFWMIGDGASPPDAYIPKQPFALPLSILVRNPNPNPTLRPSDPLLSPSPS